jgi:hypothetical protein
MKGFSILSISVVILTACSGSKTLENKIEKRAETIARNQVKEESLSHPKSNTSKNFRSTAKTVGFPFGSDILMNYKFPKAWVNNNESDSIRNINNEMDNKLIKFYNELNALGGSVKLPFTKVTPVKLDYPWKFNSRLIYQIYNLKYRLPSIGPYECYYVYGEVSVQYMIKEKKGIDFENQKPIWHEAGNLILFNPITKAAKLLNIYLSVAAPFSGYKRLFYINRDKKIHVYDFETDEEDTTFRQTYLISILDNGEIKVLETK